MRIKVIPAIHVFLQLNCVGSTEISKTTLITEADTVSSWVTLYLKGRNKKEKAGKKIKEEEEVPTKNQIEQKELKTSQKVGVSNKKS